MNRPTVWLLLITIVIVLGVRLTRPSDLYDKDQPKTVAYTVDVVENGRWVLAKDMLGRSATKPPMYNWVGAPFYALFGPSEVVLKLPSLLAAVVTAWLCALMTCRLVLVDAKDRLQRVDVMAVAVILWLGNLAAIKLIYLARPDMVLAAFMTGAWILATHLLLTDGTGAAKRHARFGWQLGLWLCIAMAALTKGLPALVCVVYILVGGRLLRGKWATTLNTGIVWGFPLALGLVGLWLWGTYVQDEAHFRAVYMGSETTERVMRHGVFGIITELWVFPGWFVLRFAPWSVLCILLLIHIKPSKWFTHATGPATLWTLLVLFFFSMSGGKRADYLAPVYPAAVAMALFWILDAGKKHGLTMKRTAMAGTAIAAGLAAASVLVSPARQTRLGEHVIEFAEQIQTHVGDDPIVFIDTGYTPLQSLLGRNQAAIKPSAEQLAQAKWRVQPHDELNDNAVIISEDIYFSDTKPPRRLALYRQN